MSEFRRSRRLLMVVVLTAGALPGAWLLVGPSESTPDPLRAHRLLGARRLPTEERVALAIEATDRIRPSSNWPRCSAASPK